MLSTFASLGLLSVCRSFQRGHQEDAEEFLGFFLETLHEELLYLHSRHISRTTKPAPAHTSQSMPNGHLADGDEEREVSRPVSPSAKADDGWLEVGKKQKINVVRNVSWLSTCDSAR
jgi:ubiquitin carboxyl-terminal hydrolase 10